MRWDIEVFFKCAKSLLRLQKEFQGRSYDLLVSPTTIVFSRYILLAWQHRKSTDARSFGGLFYLLCDEVRTLALQQLLELIHEVARQAGKRLSALIQRQVQQWISALLNYLKAYLPISCCESWDSAQNEVTQIINRYMTLPIHQMFMVANRMAMHFNRMGITTIGDLAQLSLQNFKRMLRLRMGKQSDIQAECYWQTANGIDPSPVDPTMRGTLKSVSHGKTLRSSIYRRREDIEVVLLELAVEVCRRARRNKVQGRESVLEPEKRMDFEGRFGRQTTMLHSRCRSSS